MINGDRVKQVRELRGLTQTEFSQIIGVNQSTVAQIETGRMLPSEDVLQRIILKTGFPLSFFKQPSSVDFPLGSLQFRTRKSVTQKEVDGARQFARMLFEAVEKLEQTGVKKLQVCLPRLQADPVKAAIQTRSALGLAPDAPISNFVNETEKKGVLVIALPMKLKKMDAFSVWLGSEDLRPLIVITNDSAPGDRLRFSLAHELGHLVLHQAVIGRLNECENQANMFASEFLMPGETIRHELPPVTLVNLQELKLRWKVSIQALIRRAYDLGIITIRHYKYLMSQVSARGWRAKEPINIPAERPRKVAQLSEMKFGSPVDHKSLANALSLPAQLVEEVLQVHSLRSSLEDGSSQLGSPKILNFVRNNIEGH